MRPYSRRGKQGDRGEYGRGRANNNSRINSSVGQHETWSTNQNTNNSMHFQIPDTRYPPPIHGNHREPENYSVNLQPTLNGESTR